MGEEPKNSRLPVKNQLSLYLPLIKDAITELENLQKPNDADEEKDEWDVDISPQMLELVPSCVVLFACTFSVVNMVHSVVSGSEEQPLELSNLLLEHSKNLCGLVDQVGSSFYENELSDTLAMSHTLVEGLINVSTFIKQAKQEPKKQELNLKFMDIVLTKANNSLEEMDNKIHE